MERPPYIKVCFENDTVNEQTHDASILNAIDVKECHCKIGIDS